MAKVPNSVKISVRKRAMNCCERCGTKIVRNKAGFHNGSFHHRLPQRMGGRHTNSNLVLLCLGCHKIVHRDEFHASMHGWISWDDPDVTPVLRAGARARSGQDPTAHGWALLVPDGTLEHLSHQEGERLCAYVNGIGFARCLTA